MCITNSTFQDFRLRSAWFALSSEMVSSLSISQRVFYANLWTLIHATVECRTTINTKQQENQRWPPNIWYIGCDCTSGSSRSLLSSWICGMKRRVWKPRGWCSFFSFTVEPSNWVVATPLFGWWSDRSFSHLVQWFQWTLTPVNCVQFLNLRYQGWLLGRDWPAIGGSCLSSVGFSANHG